MNETDRIQDPQRPHEATLVQRGHWLEMDPRTTYAIARLRYQVFTMGQGITEEDLDGLDLAPDTITFWLDVDGVPASTLRVLSADSETPSIGRVATSPRHRGRGLAARLLRAALAEYPDTTVHIHAQAYLEQWYEKFGFVRCGNNDVEAGIDHVPMRRLPDHA